MPPHPYYPKIIESKWSEIWEKQKLFRVDIKNAKRPFYNLAMFPYPSAEGLHVGHIIPYSGVDAYGRFLRMNGHDVFEPMGFDAFGIHSENFAIKKGLHPKTLISRTTRYFREKQMKRLGTLFDWGREVNTTDPDYYKWTQWLFIQMFKHGLAEKKKSPVTYCPSCKTVLSDEQTEVKDGVTVCERCKTPIERRALEQWFFKITKYADKLLNNLNSLNSNAYGRARVVPEKDFKNGINWTEKTKQSQRQWIGRKDGINITYDVVGEKKTTITCFTTRPDTNFGATFVVVAPEHPFVRMILSPAPPTAALKEIQAYVARTRNKTEQERIAEGRKKTGVFTGFYCLNQLNNEKMPIWISDFVLMTVGTGAVVGVPGHDKRDFEFATTFNLPIKRVVIGSNCDTSEITRSEQVQEEEGRMINSEFLNGLDIHEATKKMMGYLEEKGWGKRVTTYKLRDWCISRQRYWGPPIPMINCAKCGWQPVPEKDLPVLLPFVKDYKPTGDGKSPLAKNKKWMKVRCPNCDSWAERETDVSDTFLDSAWYFLRYPSVDRTTIDHQSSNLPWDSSITQKWLPVDLYIGGHEHAVLHLMYARFVTMALKDMGYIDFEEPFKRFFAHGLLIKEGSKMSKSRGNVVNPNIYLDKYGADTLRMYILFLGPYDAGGDFRDMGIAGMHRFLNRVWNLVTSYSDLTLTTLTNSEKLYIIMHKTIKKVTEDIKELHFNTAIAAIMEYYNALSSSIPPNTPNPLRPLRPPKTFRPACAEWQEAVRTLLLLLAPFAPFITEELWQTINKSSIHNEPWPSFDLRFLQEQTTTVIVQVNGKLRGKLEMPTARSKVQSEVEKLALQNPKIQSRLSPHPPDRRPKSIFVPGKLINFVNK